jgi:protein pelota
MKLLGKDIDKDGSGSVTLLPEEVEDIWHAYNLIFVGDHVRATTVRRIQTTSTTGSVKSERLRLTLTIEVQKIEFEAEAGVLRLNGPNCSESQHVKMGAYHTIDLEKQRKFTIFKQLWDEVALDRVQMACDPAKSADVAAVIMSEGLAHLCLISGSMTIVRARIETSIPRKRRGSTALHDQGLKKFFENILRAVLQHVDFAVVKCLIIASPGFVKDQFNEYMLAQAVQRDLKQILENKSKFILAHASSGHRFALKEILSDPAILPKIQDTKAAGEVRALNDFYQMMKNDPDRAFYGLSDVMAANQRLAIQTLLLSDDLFRSADVAARKKYLHLVESVRENGGEVKLFSALHVSGEQLKQLGGIAAILRFPVTDLQPEDEDEDEDEDEKEKEKGKDKQDTVVESGSGSGSGSGDKQTNGTHHQNNNDEEEEEEAEQDEKAS